MTRRLHRSESDKKFFGVCGGIAETLRADPSVIRIAVVLLALRFPAISVVGYAAAALILPFGSGESGEA